MGVIRENVTEGREDLSRFVIHLTRNDKRDFSNGGTARENFLNILEQKEIKAFRPHCLYNKKIKDLSKSAPSNV